MTIISAVKTFITTCPSLGTGALLLVDHIDTPISYSIVPLPGERIVEKYLDGGSLREYPFTLQTAKSTADDLARIDSAGFSEIFADWLESQSELSTFTTALNLGTKKTAISIEETSWGFLYEQGESDTGIYQITCKLTYEQQP
jgi:hypothetical protein